MTVWGLLKKKVEFWIWAAVALILMILWLLMANLFCPWFVRWEDLPALPSGETARDFTDVLSRNRINVVTDQGHYFSCRYEAEETCWVPIPREVNTPQSRDVGTCLPFIPRGTRREVHTTGRFYDENFILVAIIRENGQVAYATYPGCVENRFFYTVVNGCCASLFLVVVVWFFDLYSNARSIMREEKPPDLQETP